MLAPFWKNEPGPDPFEPGPGVGGGGASTLPLTRRTARWLLAPRAIHRHVDAQGPAVQLLAVQGGDGGLGGSAVGHFHEPEALGAAGVPIGDDAHRLYSTVGAEQGAQVRLLGV